MAVRKMKGFEGQFYTQRFSLRGLGIPLLLMVIGLYYLLRNLGYISENVPFWSIIFIVLGAYWLIQRLTYNLSKR